jgi:polyisoprenyl-phosphate glycosyltransferase
MPHISVVTPVYKSEGCLEELYRRLVDALSGITQDFEIVMVEDCGGDRSWDIIRDLAAKDPRVKGIQFSRNFGQHYGITAGLDHCDGDWVVVMDCDLQDRPEEIPRLYAKAQEGYEVVIARRTQNGSPLSRGLTSWAFYRLFSWLADMDYDGQAGNYRMISRKVVDNIRHMREQLRFFGALINWMGFSTAAIDVPHDTRFEGRSTYTLAKLWRLAFETIVAYSDKPLRMAVRLGFVISLFAFGYGLYILWHALAYGSEIVGWASLIVSIYFIGGIIIAILGMLGIYLGKTFDETKKRPLYIVVHKTFNGGRQAD